MAEARDYEEKRDYIRMTVDCEVSFKELEGSAEEQGRAKNLSGRGVLFQVGHELKIGSMLELSVLSSNNAVSPLNALVEVVRVEMIEPGKLYEIGALFHEVR